MTPWVRAPLGDLTAARPELLVIGGGITGAGIARDAALRGLRVALVEAHDFGSGTSSRSSRLIHGGLRYLEQGRLHLVLQSLRERAILLRLAPHLVRPLAFVLPFFSNDRVPAWKARLGLTLYDLLAGRGNVRRHRTLGKRALLEIEPLLRDTGLRGGALYHDAQCDDARLTLAVVRGAAAAGAMVANYVRVLDLLYDAGRIVGARVRDERTGEQAEVRASVVVNATGPWTDTLRRMEDPQATPLLRPTRGVHAAVAAERIGNRHAVIFTSPLDGRVMFLLPWGSLTYIGTTDTDEPGQLAPPPVPLQAEPGDLIYLLRSANAIFPAARLGLEDIVATWAGLRPLLAAQPGDPTSRVSREHRLVTGPRGMLTIAGGKLTTFRSMAAAVVNQALRGRRSTRGGRELSATTPLPGGDTPKVEGFRPPGRELGLPDETIDHLLRLYGAEVPAIYALCRQQRELQTRLHPTHPAIAAQVTFAAQREFALTPEDVIERRLGLALETPDHGVAAHATVSRLLAESPR